MCDATPPAAVTITRRGMNGSKRLQQYVAGEDSDDDDCGSGGKPPPSEEARLDFGGSAPGIAAMSAGAPHAGGQLHLFR